MSRYRYWETRDGAEFRYATTPTLVCPYASGPPIVLADEAARLGLDLPRAWPKRHSHGASAELPGRCLACGAELERAGYDASVRMPRGTMGGMAVKEVTQRERFPLRREAKEWALEQYRVHAAVLAEEAGR